MVSAVQTIKQADVTHVSSAMEDREYKKRRKSSNIDFHKDTAISSCLGQDKVLLFSNMDTFRNPWMYCRDVLTYHTSG